MLLKSIHYREYSGQPKEWTTPTVELERVNLFVGKNATGKTRLLNIIGALGALLSGKIAPGNYQSGHYTAKFEGSDSRDVFDYQVKYDLSHVEMESLKINGKAMLSRGKSGRAKLRHEQPAQFITVQSPQGQLLSVSRRDALQHPYFEELYGWGQSVRHYRFGMNLGNATMEIGNSASENPQERFSAANDANAALGVYRYGLAKFGPKLKKRLLDDMAALGYRIDDLGIDNFPNAKVNVNNVASVPVMLYVKESDLKSKTYQSEMSTGMSRAFALLVLTTVNILEESASSILIDDIGEGLDYQRAVSLIKLLIGKTRTSPIQLIMATNDRFVMNEVPLSLWNVITREGSQLRVFNQKNAKREFSQFEGLGLSNFDFFSSDAFLGIPNAGQKVSVIRRRAN